MRARKLLLIGVVAVIGVIAARALGLWTANQFGSTPDSSQAPTPALVFAEEDLTFGPVPESESVERELRITNTSTEAVTIDHFDKSCSCLGVEPNQQVVVGPGETRTLRIKLKTAIPHGQVATDDGMYHETVDVAAVWGDGKGQRVEVTLRYSVQQTVGFDPADVRLGVVSHREPVRVTATVTLLPPITDIRVLHHPDWVVNVTAKGGGNREVTATPARPGELRVVNDSLQVVPVGADGEERPARPLFIRGEVRLDVVSLPADLPLGLLTVGTTVEESFRLKSLTNRPFEVMKVESDSPDVTVMADPTDRKLFTARAKVAGRGNQERWVTVTVRQDDTSEVMVRIPIRYLGN